MLGLFYPGLWSGHGGDHQRYPEAPGDFHWGYSRCDYDDPEYYINAGNDVALRATVAAFASHDLWVGYFGAGAWFSNGKRGPHGVEPLRDDSGGIIADASVAVLRRAI